MTLSKPCREALADLVHNKLSCLLIVDRDDRREAAILQKCLDELNAEGQRAITGKRQIADRSASQAA